MKNSKTSTVLWRQKQEKTIILEQLEKTPIVQVACEKTWISRATYYRWVKDDKVFAKSTREYMQRWISMMNDLAESQLLKSVKEWNMTWIIFWLKSRHTAYNSKVEITDTREKQELTNEEKKIVQNVLKKYK